MKYEYSFIIILLIILIMPEISKCQNALKSDLNYKKYILYKGIPMIKDFDFSEYNSMEYSFAEFFLSDSIEDAYVILKNKPDSQDQAILLFRAQNKINRLECQLSNSEGGGLKGFFRIDSTNRPVEINFIIYFNDGLVIIKKTYSKSFEWSIGILLETGKYYTERVYRTTKDAGLNLYLNYKIDCGSETFIELRGGITPGVESSFAPELGIFLQRDINLLVLKAGLLVHYVSNNTHQSQHIHSTNIPLAGLSIGYKLHPSIALGCSYYKAFKEDYGYGISVKEIPQPGLDTYKRIKFKYKLHAMLKFGVEITL